MSCFGAVQACHFYRRGIMSVRYDFDNAAAMCLAHHAWFDTHPPERWQWIFERLGDERFDALRAKAAERWDLDYDRILAELKAAS